MFTWNIQFVSKKRLEDTRTQLMVSDGGDRDVLVRIHTAIHTAEEAVELAVSVKKIIPNAQILGTSTSAILHASTSKSTIETSMPCSFRKERIVSTATLNA